MLGFLASTALAIATHVSRLDDGATIGYGGAVELISGSHPSIRMESEVVKIDRLPKGRVRAKFIFKNYGKATYVQMGFPGNASGADVTLPDAKLAQFRSFVDGRPVKVTLRNSHQVEGQEWKVWYVKQVRFGAGQTHVIEDTYTGGGGGDSSGMLSYAYVLQTGASWRGTIGKATISVDLSGLSAFSPLQLTPSGSQMSHSVATWNWTDLKPTEHDNILVAWYPGFRNIYLNGNPIGVEAKSANHAKFDSDDLFWTIGRDGANDYRYCIRRDRSIRIPAGLAASWLGAKLTTMGAKKYRLTFGKRWAEFTLGSNSLLSSDGKTTPMEFPATTLLTDDAYSPRHEVQIVGLAPLVRALGGKATLDAAAGRLDLSLKP